MSQPFRRGSEPWFPKRTESEIRRQRDSLSRRRSSAISISSSADAKAVRRWWKFTLRAWEDEQETSWWFAGTGIPLLAATIGPLANVLSIAALVTSWRECLIPGVDPARCPYDPDKDTIGLQMNGISFADPRWCYNLNVVSLIAGFIGNFFLLLNFTGRVRYIIALPVTILMWYIATGILMAITISMEVYVPPVRPQQTYSQGYWHGVLAAVLYLVSSMLLMVNMLGYFLGHYPQNFNLTDSQRTLILQTMLFFIWLAGGAAVFARVETRYGNGTFDWSFVNAIYFCDVTILTVGFGDIYTTSDAGRGLVFPFSVGGIIMLGLVISSIHNFASELGTDKIVQRHVEKSRARTFDRSVTSDVELQRRNLFLDGARPAISAPFDPVDRSVALRIVDDKEAAKAQSSAPMPGIRRVATRTLNTLRPAKKPRLLLLREEKDRFDAMRSIQAKTGKWKRWTALSISVTAFGILWCAGAVVFWQAERHEQGMTYFQGLYFCYVSLLTVGYGDLAPKSNVGRPFFIVWSLIAVPTMTILVSDMGDTIINNFKQGTYKLADFTVLPKAGVWHDFLEDHPWLLLQLQNHKARKEQKAAEQRMQRGFEIGPDPDQQDEELDPEPTLDKLAQEEVNKPSDFELARRLAQAIRKTANDLKETRPKRYNYEEWVEFTLLIRFTRHNRAEIGEEEEEEEDMIEWDWIGEDSPMMAKKSEPEFVLDRLCESMGRYIRRMAPKEPIVTEVNGEGSSEGSPKHPASRSSSQDVRRRSPRDTTP